MTASITVEPGDLHFGHNAEYTSEYAAVTAPNGTVYKLTIDVDPEPSSPAEWDSTAPMVYLTDDYVQSFGDASAVVRAWKHFAWKHDPWTLLTRWLGIHFGATVVEFGHVGSVQSSPAAVFFDTAEWREMTGWTPDSPGNPADESRTEWRQWAAGDVYGASVERLVTGITAWDDGRVTTPQRWDHVDSVWGLYGHDYAIEHGAELLSDALSDSTGE